MINAHKYFENTKNLEPNKLLKSLVPKVLNNGIALDLGSGALRDTKYLLKNRI